MVPKCRHNAFKPGRILLEANCIITALRCQLIRSVYYPLSLVKDNKPCSLTTPNNLRGSHRTKRTGMRHSNEETYEAETIALTSSTPKVLSSAAPKVLSRTCFVSSSIAINWRLVDQPPLSEIPSTMNQIGPTVP
jgi:hypothetical protein